VKTFCNPSLALACALMAQAVVAHAQAQTQAPSPASVPYTPTWQARHHLQWLADNAALPITVTHWPLPVAAVQQALGAMALPTQAHAARHASDARDFVLQELASVQSRGHVQLQLRQRAEGLPGFDENYTPGSSVQLVTSEKRVDGGAVSLAGRLGVRLEESSNSLASNASGLGTDGRYQLRAEGSAAVLGWSGWNVQAFSHRHWWGPGWQSSLINGSNSPAWNGMGLQRGTTQPSGSAWLSWMGPWNLDVFVARAQDPLVVTNQPQGYLFSGMRLTMKPMPWLEVGLSRSLQAGGAGRPSGAGNFVKAFLGQEVNQNPGDPPDSSSQIAGYDLRARCPLAWGQCAAYTQWMGEDAAGSGLPLPFKFMNLWGVEHTYAQGRYRVFAEHTNTNVYSLPWDSKPQLPGYTNGVYGQGYTHGGRWIGSAQGGGSQVTTLGWMDAQSRRMVKVHAGKVLYGVGAAYPGASAPHGQLRGISASQVLHWQGLVMTPELSWTRLSEGQDTGANQRNNLRLGLTVRMPLERF
jgi:hypothetical protein